MKLDRHMLNLVLKAKYSFITALLFFIVSNPELYRATEWLFGAGTLAIPPSFAPTPMGLLVHTALFFGAMMGLMLVPGL